MSGKKNILIFEDFQTADVIAVLDSPKLAKISYKSIIEFEILDTKLSIRDLNL